MCGEMSCCAEVCTLWGLYCFYFFFMKKSDTKCCQTTKDIYCDIDHAFCHIHLVSWWHHILRWEVVDADFSACIDFSLSLTPISVQNYSSWLLKTQMFTLSGLVHVFCHRVNNTSSDCISIQSQCVKSWKRHNIFGILWLSRACLRCKTHEGMFCFPLCQPKYLYHNTNIWITEHKSQTLNTTEIEIIIPN